MENSKVVAGPGHFALVMATGVIALAAHELHRNGIAWGLLLFGAAAYGVLWILAVARLFSHPDSVAAGLMEHARGPGFFTAVAATGVLGSAIMVIGGNARLAVTLWWFGLALWLLVNYGFFAGLVVRQDKPDLERGLNGAWLTSAVATQSLSLLGTLSSAAFTNAEPTLFAALLLFLMGSAFYLGIIILISYRLAFVRLVPAELAPPYWINSGAAAVSALAGSLLVAQAGEWSLLEDILPLLRGATLMFWAIATWWLPLLVILSLWRHLFGRVSLTYDPRYWDVVFPLGMYTLCTFYLAQTENLPYLSAIPHASFWVALAAWIATSVGLAIHLIRRLWRLALRGRGNGPALD